MKNSSLTALWTFPSVLLSAFLMAWGAEAAQFLISQGLALAALAWLQTMPEFAVEAVFAWKAGKDPALTHLVIANFTGSIRLLVGLGWPMVGLIASFSRWKRKKGGFFDPIMLDDEHAIEIFGMLAPMLYFLIIWFKATLTLVDGFILIFLYVIYILILLKLPHKEEEEMDELPVVSRWALRGEKAGQWGKVFLLLLAGGVIIFFVAEPFVKSMLAVAISLGISEFFFVQWVAPFLSEFPEKVSAFYWAKSVGKAPMGIMNFISSNINQWSVLSGLIPIIYVISVGHIQPLHLDLLQRHEILLTLAQSFFAFTIVMDMAFSVVEASILFVLFLIQFLFPSTRILITHLYLMASVIILAQLLIQKKAGRSARALAHIWKYHVRGGK